VTLHDLKKIHKDSTQQKDGFKEVHRRKRHCNEEPAQTTKKVALPTSTVKVAEKPVQEKSSRPPPIVLTSASNLIQLQKQLKGVAIDTFEFRSTKNGTRVVTKTRWTTNQLNSTSSPKTYTTILFTLNRKKQSRQ
jgi:hypothetical protein